MGLSCRSGATLAALALGISAVAAVSGASDTDDKPTFSVVFRGSEASYPLIRTPQLVVTRAGTFLAFAQGRSGHHDRSDNDIIIKRSEDGGQTWSALKTIADEGRDSLNSICVIQLRKTGRILVVGCRFPDGYEMMEFQHLSPGMQDYQRRAGREHFPAIRPGYEGRDIARNYIIHSDDDGRTWSRMHDITSMVKRPAPDVSCVPGPGLAIELREGPHAGRILVPCWTRGLAPSGTESGGLKYLVKPYAIFSDDGGETWQRGEVAPEGPAEDEREGSETQFVEFPGGNVMLNTRGPHRNVAVSRDGGVTWSSLRADPQLKSTPTAAGFLRFSGIGDGERSRVLFTNPSETGRLRGLVSLSYDNGQTWPVQKLIRAGRFGYSCLARLPDGDVGCVFESVAEKGEFGDYAGRIVLFVRFTLNWLTDGKDGQHRTSSE